MVHLIPVALVITVLFIVVRCDQQQAIPRSRAVLKEEKSR